MTALITELLHWKVEAPGFLFIFMAVICFVAVFSGRAG